MNEDKLLQAAERAIYEAITKTLSTEYRGPVKDAVDMVCKKHQDKLVAITERAYLSVLDSAEFEAAIKKAMNEKLARTLVGKLGGEIESRVNELKANPETRAKITLALTQIINKEKV